MAPTAILTAFCYIDEWDATGDSKALQVAASARELDKTTFRSAGWEETAGGAKYFTFDFDGWWQAGTNLPDPEGFNNLAVGDRVFTAGLLETEAQPAWLFRAGQFSYQAFGQYGELAPFSVNAKNTEGGTGLIRGQLAKAKADVTGTGVTGSVLNLGAPGTGQTVYCSVHIFTAGTTITLQLQSDTSAGFSSATTQATIGPLTTTGGTWATVAGPLAGETHWRLNVSAITGTFNLGAAIAVQ